MKKLSLLLLSGLFAVAPAFAQKGAITPQMLNEIRKANAPTAADRALRNALNKTGVNDLALSAENTDVNEVYFSNEVPSAGISDQKQSGRCWLFSGLNVLRAEIIKKNNLGAFQFSQSFLFFYDQLEKSNLFLQSVIDNADEPLESRKNAWLFKNAIGDGGTFCGVQALVMKYGLVPAEVMPESYNANNTSRLSQIIALKLREYGLALRKAVQNKTKSADLEKLKTEQLSTIYHILSLALGTPPESFSYTLRDKNKKAISTKTYTPRSFYDEFIGRDLRTEYVLLMNDPSREFHRVYSVDMDRHTYDSPNWTYLNLPMDEIEAIAKASIKDSTMMYMSCDVGKFYTKSGVLSLQNFNYEDLFGTDFPMDKADRIRTYASASSHAMTLMAVDLDENDQPLKWKVENSWGESSGKSGHLIMTREWLREYLFRLVPEKKYVPAETLELLKQKPIQLPAWDPLFSPEE